MRLRSVSLRVWHQSLPRWPCVGCADPARTNGRYHRKGGPGAWYASDAARAAWAEQLRHTEDALPSPFETRRKIGRVQVSASHILDLTDSQVRSDLGVTEDDLIADDVRTCQDISELAISAGARGILAPSAALKGHRTLVLYWPHVEAVATVETSRVQRIPSTIADVADQIRPLPAAHPEVVRLLRRIASEGRGVIRRIRSGE